MKAVRSELLPIGRFSRETSLSIHQLRHYHEVGLLPPARIDSESGYRYYSPVQVQTAEVIAILRSLDMPLAEIRELLRDPTRPKVQAALERHRGRLESRFAEARSRLAAYEEHVRGGRLQMRMEEPTEVVAARADSVRVHGPSAQHVVILAEEGGSRKLPIWIGPFEANAIALK